MAKERVAGRTLKIRKLFLFVENILPLSPQSTVSSDWLSEVVSSIKRAVTVCVIVRLSPVRSMGAW